MRGQLKFVKANLCTPVVPAVISVNSSRWSPSTTGPRLFIGLFHPVLMDLKGLSFDKDWLGNCSIAEFKEELSRPLSYLHQRLQWCQNFRIYSEFLSFLDFNGRICQKFWVFLGPFWVIFGPLGSFWSQQEGVSFFFVANLVITCFWGKNFVRNFGNNS